MNSIKKLFGASFIMIFFASIAMVNVASASPQAYFWVNPPVVEETPLGKFEVKINVNEVPAAYAWEVILNWDPKFLELVSVTEGDFLHRWMPNPEPPPDMVPVYDTSFVYEKRLDEVNLRGKIRVGCSLIGALPMSEWASGNGWLCSFNFIAQHRGVSYLNLTDTRLWDYIVGGYPAFTYYDNVDGIVQATNFYYAGLDGWKLKINGKAGISEELGLKTTVGKENLLEAWVRNTGTFDVNVKASIEIRDAAGYWVATLNSGIVPLPAGESYIFSATWIATEPNVYFFTAYSFYGELTPTISSEFSRTLRLKAV